MGLLGPDQRRIRVADPDGGEDQDGAGRRRSSAAVQKHRALASPTGAAATSAATDPSSRCRAGRQGHDGAVDEDGPGRAGFRGPASPTRGVHPARLWRRNDHPSSQGGTAAEHILALPAGSQAVNGLQAYSAGTRHRRQSFSSCQTRRSGGSAGSVGRSTTRREVRRMTSGGTWRAILDYQPKKDLALEMIGRVMSLRRGSVCISEGFQRVEQRDATRGTTFLAARGPSCDGG